MAQKKYVSLSRLSTFLDNLKTTFSSLSHKHKLSDITDYTVDSTLSSTSTNPVQNNVIKASLDEKVPNTRAVNGKVLSADITLSASDIGSYTKAETDSKIEEAKSYTDTKTSGLASTAVVDNKISTHNTSTTAHNDIRVLITDLTTKLNNFLDVDDTTTDQLSEVLALIENNRGTLESLTTNKINVSDIIDNLTTNNSSKVLSAAQGVAIKNLIDALQTAVNGKQSAVTGGASTITSSNLTSNRALVSNGSGKVAISDITSTELGYLDGVTANVQTQLNAKAASSHTHDYAGSSSAGGAATSANKLNTDAGSVTQPVYFKDGVPVSTSHTLNADVPENAKFTDTTYEVATQSTDGLLSASDKMKLDNGGIPIVTTSGNSSAYTATVDGISTLTAGMKVTIIPHVTSETTSPTLNVNNLGVKPIRMPITYNSSATSVGPIPTWIVKNAPITVEYDGTYWKTISCSRPSAQHLYGTVPVINGGTGLTSVTYNSFLVGNDISNMTEKTPSEVLDLITDGSISVNIDSAGDANVLIGSDGGKMVSAAIDDLTVGFLTVESSDVLADCNYQTYTISGKNSVDTAVIRIVIKMGWCFVSGSITPSNRISGWTTILDETNSTLEIPQHGQLVPFTIPRWDSTYVQPLRGKITPNGELQIAYGAANKEYVFSICYPI